MNIHPKSKGASKYEEASKYALCDVFVPTVLDVPPMVSSPVLPPRAYPHYTLPFSVPFCAVPVLFLPQTTYGIHLNPAQLP